MLLQPGDRILLFFERVLNSLQTFVAPFPLLCASGGTVGCLAPTGRSASTKRWSAWPCRIRSKHYPSQLSGGQQQRVAVARALAGDPLILVADEPTGNLDSQNGEAVIALLRELHRSGATISMVTHDPRYSEYADRTVHLFDGRIVEERVAARN